MPVEIDIEHVARLARLELTDEEKARLRVQLGVILEHAAAGRRGRRGRRAAHRVARSPGRTCSARTCRSPRLPVEEALRNAPDRDGDRFKVPRIAETGT